MQCAIKSKVKSFEDRLATLVKVETLEDDFDAMKKRFPEILGNLNLPWLQKSLTDRDEEVAEAKTYMRQLSAKERAQVAERYRHDFALFDYRLDEY
jgi:glycine cleavage system regulatory protein